MKRNPAFLILLLSALSIFSSRAELIVALTSDNRLLTFDSATPATAAATVAVTGLASGEALLAIDFRPATGELFALGGSNRIYTVNASTGAATPVGGAGVFTLTGTQFGFDFNPTVDRIRITSNTGLNLRVNPNDGTLSATDTALTAGFTVAGSAYSNNVAGAVATTLFGIDPTLDSLVIQNPPNAGALVVVGGIGFNATAVGFDISGRTGAAYAALQVGGTSGLYTVDLGSGTATLRGTIAPAALGTASVVGIAAAVVAPPGGGARLLNISTRGRVGTGEDILIAGFISGQGVSSRLAIRGIGPSMAGPGVIRPLNDPSLTLFDKNGTVIASNDNFGSLPAADQAELALLGLTPNDLREAAILVTLPADQYTVHLFGKDGATGVGLVEVYATQ